MAHGSRRTKRTISRSEADLVSATRLIHEAVLAPELWPEALSLVSHVCGAEWTVLSAIPLNAPATGTTLQNEDQDPERLRVFSSSYTLPENNPSVPILLASALGHVTLREDHFTDKEWERTAIYDEIYRPAGVHASLGVKLLHSSRHIVPIGMMRSRSKGSYETTDLAALRELVPHLHTALQTTLRLETLTTRAHALAEAWNRLPYGLVLLDRTGQLLWSNTIGETLLSKNDVVTVRGGHLVASASHVNKKLRQLIGQCTLSESGRSGALRVPRMPPARPLVLSVSAIRPMSGGLLFLEPRPPAVAVFVSDPDLVASPPRSVFRELYGFTNQEANLALLLLEGYDLREASDVMGVSFTTVRGYLRQLFQKTDTHRQAELVRLLSNAIVA